MKKIRILEVLGIAMLLAALGAYGAGATGLIVHDHSSVGKGGPVNAAVPLRENGVRVYSSSNPPPIGDYATYTDVSGSRAKDTVYQNTGTSSIFVFITGNGGGSVTRCTLQAGVTSNPTTTVGAITSGVGESHALTFSVPANYYYRMATGSGGVCNIATWIEAQNTAVSGIAGTCFNCTLSNPTITGNATLTGATLANGSFTAPILSSPTITGTATLTGATLANGSFTPVMVSASGNVKGVGVYDTGTRVYSPANPPPGGGDLTAIGSCITAAASSSVEFSAATGYTLTGYKKYIFKGTGIALQSSGGVDGHLLARFGTGAGPTWETSNYRQSLLMHESGGITVYTVNAVNSGFMQILSNRSTFNGVGDTNASGDFSLEWTSLNDAAAHPRANLNGQYTSVNSNIVWVNGAFSMSATGNNTNPAVQFYADDGFGTPRTITIGEFCLYGSNK